MDHEGLYCPNRPPTPRKQRLPDPRSRGPHLHIQTGRSKTERRRPRRQTNNRPLLWRLGRTTPGRNGRQRRSRSQTTRAACAQNRAAKGSEIMTFESMSQFLPSVAEAAVRSIALALAVGSLLAVTKLGHPRLRLLAWTGVLYISMMMPLLALALPAIKLPLLPGNIATLSNPDNAQQVAPAGALAPASNGMPVEPVRAFPPTGIRADAGAAAARPNTVITKETFNQGKAALPDSAATSVAATARRLSWSE